AIDGVVMAKAPRTIAGLIEVRGVGIVTVPHLDNVEIALAVQLGQAAVRMPDAAHEMIAGIAVPKLLLDAREPSVPIKVEIALARLIEGHP
ncbi:MAG: aldolase, partial [Sphingomonas sp.]